MAARRELSGEPLANRREWRHRHHPLESPGANPLPLPLPPGRKRPESHRRGRKMAKSFPERKRVNIDLNVSGATRGATPDPWRPLLATP